MIRSPYSSAEEVAALGFEVVAVRVRPAAFPGQHVVELELDTIAEATLAIDWEQKR